MICTQPRDANIDNLLHLLPVRSLIYCIPGMVQVICTCSKCRRLTCIDHGINVPGRKVSAQTQREHEAQDLAASTSSHPYQRASPRPGGSLNKSTIPPAHLDLTEGQLNIYYSVTAIDEAHQLSSLSWSSAVLLLLGCLFMQV